MGRRCSEISFLHRTDVSTVLEDWGDRSCKWSSSCFLSLGKTSSSLQASTYLCKGEEYTGVYDLCGWVAVAHARSLSTLCMEGGIARGWPETTETLVLLSQQAQQYMPKGILFPGCRKNRASATSCCAVLPLALAGEGARGGDEGSEPAVNVGERRDVAGWATVVSSFQHGCRCFNALLWRTAHPWSCLQLTLYMQQCPGGEI